MDQNRVENQVDEGTLQIHLTNASTGIPVKGQRSVYLIREVRSRC